MYRKIAWIVLGLLTLALRTVSAGRPDWIESYYSRGLFLGIRWVIDYLFAWLPIPLIYLFFGILLLAIVRQVRKGVRKKDPLRKKILNASLSVSGFLGGLIFFFFFLWGFNYGREPIEKQLALQVNPLSLPELYEELMLETKTVIELRSRIKGAAASQALTRSLLPASLETLLRQDLEGWLDQHDFPVVGRVRARKLWPPGIFLRFSSSGLYFPLTGEGNVDAGVHPLQLPFVMAHELSHGYGFGDEGTCNFLAYLSCTRSEDPFIAYAGHLGYWRTLAGNFLRQEPEKYMALRKSLPAGIRADLDAINESLNKYPEIMPRLRYQAYDTYLKSQGIREGMLNYNRIVMLVRAWRNARKT